MKLKKLVSLLLALTIIVSSFAACGSNGNDDAGDTQDNAEQNTDDNNGNGEGDSTSDEIVFPLSETMKFTGFASMYGEVALTDNLAWQTALERANIDIELTNVLQSELGEKRNLILASNEYPEVFFKASFSASDLENYGGQGILIPLEDLMREYAPNFCALMDETDGWDYITASDGHVYSFPMQNGKDPQVCYWINKRWLDNLGLEEPTSFDELYEVLKAFKEQDANGNGDPNDEIPMVAYSGDPMINLFVYQDYVKDPSYLLGIENEELFFVPTSDYFKEVINFATRLYEEGLVNQDCFTLDNAQKRSNGQIGDTYGFFQDTASFLTVGRDNDDDYIMLTPFTEGTYPLTSKYTTGALSITDACENPEVIVAWADYFYTEEGGTLAWMGVEGETYQMNDDGTWDWIVGGEYGDDIATVRSNGTLNGGPAMPVSQPELWAKMSASSDEDEVYLNSERRRIYELGEVFPYLSYTDEENTALSTLITDIYAYVNEYYAQVVTGELVLEDSWDDYVNTLNQMGLEEMVSIFQAAYARTLE